MKKRRPLVLESVTTHSLPSVSCGPHQKLFFDESLSTAVLASGKSKAREEQLLKCEKASAEAFCLDPPFAIIEALNLMRSNLHIPLAEMRKRKQRNPMMGNQSELQYPSALCRLYPSLVSTDEEESEDTEDEAARPFEELYVCFLSSFST